MSRAGRAVALPEGPLDIPETPSTGTINVKKFPFLAKGKPGDGLKLSVSATIESVRMDENEHIMHVEFQELIPQPKEEKQEPANGIIPK